MFRYFISREFLLTVLGYAALCVVGYILVFYMFLPNYTHHGASVVVPDVMKMSVKEAGEKLDDADLDFKVTDSIYLPNTPAQSIVKQYPNASNTVKPGRTVFLTVNKSVPPTVKMPKVVDLSVYQAKAKLESWKLQVKEVRKVPDIARNMVLRVLYEGKDIKEGTDILQGSGVVLVIGAGVNEKYVRVPNVIGMVYSEAATRISTAGFGVTPLPDGKSGDGKVFDQYPKGDSARQGGNVDLMYHGTGN